MFQMKNGVGCYFKSRESVGGLLAQRVTRPTIPLNLFHVTIS